MTITTESQTSTQKKTVVNESEDHGFVEQELNNEHVEHNTIDREPWYVLMLDDYLLAKPKAFASSNRTQDIKFFDLAVNLELQYRMKLASAVFISPINPFAKPATGRKLLEYVARYLAAFKLKKEGQDHIYEYLMGNGDLRILWLKEEHEATPAASRQIESGVAHAN